MGFFGGKMLKLICKKEKIAHWGVTLEKGKEYSGTIITKPTEVITNHVKYWEYMSKIANSRRWIKKGYKEEKLNEVIPEYKTYSDVKDLYTKRIDMPFVRILCSDNHYNEYCLLTDNEIYSLGADMNKDGNRKGQPAFSYTVHRVDDYFDYTLTRRDNTLNELLK